MSIIRFLLLSVIFLNAAASSSAGDLQNADIGKLINKRNELIRTMNVPNNAHGKEGDKRAAKIMNKLNSAEYQERIRLETDRVMNSVFHDRINPDVTTTAVSAVAYGRLRPDERLYIFVSSSVPLQTLRTFAARIDAIADPNISMVMRGFVGGMKHWDKMIDYSSGVLMKDSACEVSSGRCEILNVNFEVDPLLFRRYGVKTVPTVVFATGVNSGDPGMSEGLRDTVRVSDFTSIGGDMSLSYLIGEIAKETGNPSLQSLVASLERSFNDGR